MMAQLFQATISFILVISSPVGP